MSKPNNNNTNGSSFTDSQFFQRIRPFLFGGISGMVATAVIQPIDTIKVRIQIMGENLTKGSKNPISVGRSIIKAEGVNGLYKGLGSALFRQATYGTARLGLYKSIYEMRMRDVGEVPLYEKSLISIFAGFVGALIGNPSDLILVRFQSDSTLPPEQRRNYKNLFDAFVRIIKEDGVKRLWRGSVPTVVRGVSMNLGQLASFDQFKEMMISFRGKWDMLAQMTTVVAAGIVCAVVSLPSDNLKTKLMKMKKREDGTFPYKGFMDCLFKSVKREGVFGLWIGLPTYIIRVGPHSIVSLLMLDTLTHLFPDKL